MNQIGTVAVKIARNTKVKTDGLGAHGQGIYFVGWWRHK